MTQGRARTIQKEIERRKKISIKNKGKRIWNKGIHMWKNKEHPKGMLGKKHTKKSKDKISKTSKRRISPMKGKKQSKETRKKISEKTKGKNNPFYGKHHSLKSKKKISENKERSKKISKAMQGRKITWNKKISETRKKSGCSKGKKNPSWKGGITPERPKFYKSDEWKKISKKVWKRDNATCQRCYNKFKNKGKTFEIHHIKSFEDKRFRLKIKNLILLCNHCHNWVHSRKNTNKDFIQEVLN